MKRHRDDVPTGSQLKSISPERWQTAEAYTNEVWETFKDQSDKYDMYIALMKDYKDKRTDTAGVIARVNDIFKGHDNLIRDFMTFVPKGYDINLDEDGAPPSMFNQGFEFCEKVKERLGIVDEYWLFLKCVQDYLMDIITEQDLQLMVNRVLGEHRDLVYVFSGNLSNENSDEFLDGVMSKKRMRTGEDLPSCWQYEETSCELMEDAFTYIKEMEETFQDEKEKHDMFLDVLKEYHDRRIGPTVLIARVKELIKGHTNLLHGFNTFLPEGYEINPNEDAIQKIGIVLCRKVKERLGSVDEYQRFLKLLYKQRKMVSPLDTVTKQNLQDAVTSILGKHPDLMDEFNQLLENENIDKFLARIKRSRRPSSGTKLG